MQLVPTNRPKPASSRNRSHTWPIAAIGRLNTDRELDLEARRQVLLNRRWQRWRSIIFTMTLSVTILSGAIPTQRALDWLLSVG